MAPAMYFVSLWLSSLKHLCDFYYTSYAFCSEITRLDLKKLERQRGNGIKTQNTRQSVFTSQIERFEMTKNSNCTGTCNDKRTPEGLAFAYLGHITSYSISSITIPMEELTFGSSNLFTNQTCVCVEIHL